MNIPNSILQKFIHLWKEETGINLSVNQAISKLRVISDALSEDKRIHQAIKNQISFGSPNADQNETQ